MFLSPSRRFSLLRQYISSMSYFTASASHSLHCLTSSLPQAPSREGGKNPGPYVRYGWHGPSRWLEVGQKQRSFVPFTAMEGATDGVRVCVISEVSPTFLPSPGVPNPWCVGLWEGGRVKRAGEGRRGRASPAMAQQVVSSGEIF